MSLLGKEGAEEKLQHEADSAYRNLETLQPQYDTSHLNEIIQLFVQRDH